jgi:cellulose synthase/poly-beta-1,6-N-acetylglucosamine synthase-like glycosyltransferase
VILLLILLLASTAYFLIALYLSQGIHSQYERREDLPMVSVVVPVRDEEAHLPDLLGSLLATDYPPERMEIIIVDDESQDRTREIALSYKNRFKCRFDVQEVVAIPGDKLILKTRPLAQGIERATGEVVLMTDADCIVPPQWIRTMASFFTPSVGMVCGTTLPHPGKDAKYPLTWFETLDWMFLLGASAGLSGRGHPQALIGNNFTVRREAYESIGTFRNLDFTDIDDIALLMAIKESGKWSIVFPANAGTLLYTRPIPSLCALARQRRRWIKGFAHTNWPGKFVIALGALTHVTVPAWPFLFGWPSIFPFTLLALGDALVLAKMLRRYRLTRIMSLIPLYPVFASVYGIGMVFLLLVSRKVPWKGREF